ncbi:MAG: type VI secretion system-associated FHA domain protein TagH [Telluria sp.]
MLIIRAISRDGRPVTRPIEGEFDELGGSIGRAEGNVLVLPDPERHISRTQATIAFRQGGYLIRDCGSSVSVVLNGRPLVKGVEAPLAGGDTLQIGGYTLEALATAPPSDDPLVLFARGDAGSFAAGLPPAAPPTVPNAGGFDPFAGNTAPEGSPALARIPDDFDLGPGSAPNIDQMFGLDRASAADPLSPGSPLGEPAAGAGPMSLDPLVALGAAPAPVPPPPAQRDDAMEIRAAYIPPTVSFGGAPAPAAADGARAAIRTVVVPSPRPAASTPAAPQPAEAPAAPAREAGPDAAAAQPAPADAASAELLRAFLQGAGVPGLDLHGPLTPQAMEAIGQLLRAATGGLVDLLLARALIKREMHADVTIIAQRENNPLKFSPNVDVALAHLLAPRAPGFLGPVAAVRDACDDLRAHQFAVIAGMRAALEGVLHRFDPAQLERRLSGQNVFDTLLPMHRKARLWSLFGELYGELNREAQDDFDTLFGKEFVRAYEAQLDQLQGGAPKGR